MSGTHLITSPRRETTFTCSCAGFSHVFSYIKKDRYSNRPFNSTIATNNFHFFDGKSNGASEETCKLGD